MATELGDSTEPLRILSFSGGAYDTVMQLGVAHALLVGRLRPPHSVVGLSAGAITAVALAEILQAGETPPGDVSPTQIAKLRELINAYVTAPPEMAQALIPDIYQIDAERPLRPARLALQSAAEDEDRDQATLARSGLISLANDVLGLRVTVRTVTLLVRTVLGWYAARAAGGVRGAAGAVIAAVRLWFIFAANIVNLAPLTGRLVTALLAPAIRGIKERTVLNKVPWLRRGVTAGEIIYSGWRLTRWLGRAVWVVIGFIVNLTACLLTLTWAMLLILIAAVVLMSILDLLRFDVAALQRLVPDEWLRSLAGLALAASLALAVLAFLLPVLAKLRDLLAHRLFDYYKVADGILDPHCLRVLFIKLFDPAYYGRVDLRKIVSELLTDKRPQQRPAAPKRLAAYSNATKSPIEVGIAAARVSDGRVGLLPPHTGVVRGLLTAVALPPFFEAQRPHDEPGSAAEYYIDASVVENEPVCALLDRIRGEIPGFRPVNPGATEAHVYSVCSLPLGKALPENRGSDDLVDLALRSLRLERLRDQTLLRRSTRLYSRRLPGTGILQSIEGVGKQLVKAWVIPIEPEAPIDLNRTLPLAVEPAARRDLVLGAIAAGCRATLQALNPNRLVRLDEKRAGTLRCRELVARLIPSGEKGPAGEFPGSDQEIGPGLSEICSVCCLGRTTKTPLLQSLRVPLESENSNDGSEGRSQQVDWPAVYEESVPSAPAFAPPSPPLVAPAYAAQLKVDLDAFRDWASRESWAPKKGPTVSLLFAGGVFRGVYLVGVLNALSELGAKPHVVAGSSVGTITAAMSATVLGREGGQPVSLKERRQQVRNLAMTFMVLDRLVLTDRFADFIRGFTIRSAATRFSLRQLDRTFRTYDRHGLRHFGGDARGVLAGLERLFYVSPFDAVSIARFLRRGDTEAAVQAFRESARKWLTRSGVDQQMLGAEPLRTLIEHHVLKPLGLGSAGPRDLTLAKTFLNHGVLFLATATNLDEGSLEFLGLNPTPSASTEAMLVETLLASSAFPAVFRPRHSWEVMPRSRTSHRYIDGGVMDNLPLDAVALVLHELSSDEKSVLERRPKTPHLMFTASLEALSPTQDVEEVRKRWWRIWGRAREFRYNNKLNDYARMERIINKMGANDAKPPVNIEVVKVIPRWLCGTFEFHPMLGFRSERQAASIAHGCATTLAAFARVGRRNLGWLSDWRMDPAALSGERFPAQENDPLVPSTPATTGNCWFRHDHPCPFFGQKSGRNGPLARVGEWLRGPNRALHEGSVNSSHAPDADTNSIYRLCGQAMTHSKDGGDLS